MSVWDWLLIADGIFLVLVFVGGPILLSRERDEGRPYEEIRRELGLDDDEGADPGVR